MKFTIRKSDGSFEKVDFRNLTSIQQSIILESASKKKLRKIILHLIEN